MRRPELYLLIGLLALASWLGQADREIAGAKPPAEPTQAELQVVAAAIDQFWDEAPNPSGWRVVIAEHSLSPYPGAKDRCGFRNQHAETRSVVQAGFSELISDEELSIALRLANLRPVGWNHQDIPSRIRLASPSVLEYRSLGPGDLERARARGILCFSRPGFNRKRDTAVLACGDESTFIFNYYLLTLHLVEDGWKLDRKTKLEYLRRCNCPGCPGDCLGGVCNHPVPPNWRETNP